ncbi:HAD family hydrolase [Nocardioides albus]|uniref:Putative hydrolase of the HAD superfamily n=1 Tax=Nocardioides albus TaxID=1841 RepID=A0A7W5A3W6_9ACTN|nr:HAD family phosphatase [Nocardioides albus]MBB3089010.1 putative hydrolase of the HAD superfamily [Nocardioides albus]GGU14833.1 phosphoglycolate phosphatase [Nocardioides albus]
MVDFGGVLTTSVIESFRAFGTEIGDRDLPLRLLSRGEPGSGLIVAHEEGRISAEEFETGFAALLGERGVQIESAGLIARLQAKVNPDPDMIALVADLRAEGRPVGLLSNSFGADLYDGWNLSEMFDAITISGEIGVRKPSRRAYRIACENLGVEPEETVMVDDLQQNIHAAARIGMGGVVHRDAASTRAELAVLLTGAVTA